MQQAFEKTLPFQSRTIGEGILNEEYFVGFNGGFSEERFSRLGRLMFCLFCLQLVMFPDIVRGHGLLEEQISEASVQLRATPLDHGLRLRRAGLYLAHAQPLEAREDLVLLTQSAEPFRDAFLLLATLEKDEGNFKKALVALSRYFRAGGNSPDSHRLNARVCRSLGFHQRSSRSWDEYLGTAETPSAADFCEAGRSFDESENEERADLIYQRGFKAFPRSIPLHQHYAGFLVSRKNLERAKEVFERLRSIYPELSHRLFYEEGKSFDRSGFDAEARLRYEAALGAINRLPLRKKSLPAIRALEAEILLKLNG